MSGRAARSRQLRLVSTLLFLLAGGYMALYGLVGPGAVQPWRIIVGAGIVLVGAGQAPRTRRPATELPRPQAARERRVRARR